jgi:ribulose 1,5-bisphosphate carboxylase large subunit-like protein
MTATDVDRSAVGLVLDVDSVQVHLRRVVAEHLADRPAPALADAIVATYFLALRSQQLEEAAQDIVDHGTSGIRNPAPGSLLAACTGQCLAVDPFDRTGRVGLVHVAFPLRMLLHADGRLTTTDILHSVAGAPAFDIYEHQQAALVSLQIPPAVMSTFPGPAYGPDGVRALTGFEPGEPMFGTILKPTAGLTTDDVASLVREIAGHRMLGFIKEDENFYPHVPDAPLADRVRAANAAIADVSVHRGGRPLIFAPHISGAPNEIVDSALEAVEAGASGVMFSQTFAYGSVRMVREATMHLPNPPAIYGHNAGIGVTTTSIWREVSDLLARLDGIDFRQTGPVRPGAAFIRPFGAEWEASEEVLQRPIQGIRPTMISRAGALDQGNIVLNLQDARRRGVVDRVLFLAGSAFNSIKGANGRPDPSMAVAAMQQAIDFHRSGELDDASPESHVGRLKAFARRDGLTALETALAQRYPTASGGG